MLVCQFHHIFDALFVDSRIAYVELGDVGSRIALFL